MTCSVDPITLWKVPTKEDLARMERELNDTRKNAKEMPLVKMQLESAAVGWQEQWPHDRHRKADVEHIVLKVSS